VTKRQKFALILLPFPILLGLLSFTGWSANDYVFYGAVALAVALLVAIIAIRLRYDHNET
jgi:hypothetical protein